MAMTFGRSGGAVALFHRASHLHMIFMPAGPVSYLAAELGRPRGRRRRDEMPFRHRNHSRGLWELCWTCAMPANHDGGESAVVLASSRKEADMTSQSSHSRPRVVIVGAGFAGLSAAKALAASP